MTFKDQTPSTDLKNKCAIADKLATFTWSEFAQSLCSQFETRGDLSPKQWAAAKNMIAKIEAREARAKTVRKETSADRIGLPQIVNLFAKAKASGLKFPKLRLQTTDGQRVVLSQAGPNARVPFAINVTDGGPFGNNVWFGRIHPEGKFEGSRNCNDDVVALLKEIQDDPAVAAKVQGLRTNNCCFCGLTLTADPSIEAGYGPICADKWGLPWGERS